MLEQCVDQRHEAGGVPLGLEAGADEGGRKAIHFLADRKRCGVLDDRAVIRVERVLPEKLRGGG